ncbi:HAD family hydrolase [Oceanotoga teriensis]|uniref:HAD family hydrolase n=1 Tax=Oceanotoga teriensis TaxID=515440 RepID=UPI0027129CB9|nr:HAD family hydrolase [Oceanotoga teriensis]MDO7977877.1 HAD family hydrolase [Oceanotoga teriensis]
MKTFVFDLDGTLLNSNSEISKKNIEAMKMIIQSKNQLILASGRMLVSMKKIIDKYIPFIKGISPIISYNGAYIIDEKDKLIYESIIDKKIAVDLINHLRNIKSHRQIYVKDVLISEEENDFIEFYSKHANVDYKIVKDLNDFIMQKDNDPLKILCIDDELKIREIENEIQNKFSNKLNIVLSFKNFLDIMSKEASKGNAIKKISKIYNINFEQLYVFGDSNNDISMFEITNNSFTLNNANKNVKSAAKHILPSNDEDGVYYAVKKILNDDNNFDDWIDHQS